MQKSLIMADRKLPHSFYERPTLEVAPELIGKILVSHRNGITTSGRIVEVEAYRSSDDPASHAFRGLTPRNHLMFGEAGYAYVYFIYGMYFCVNAVCEVKGTPGACLIRAVEPIEGVPAMKRRRKLKDLHQLTNGPGKLCIAMGIDRHLNGADLFNDELYIMDDGRTPRIAKSRRIGIRVGVEKRWRFFAKGHAHVSKSPWN